MKFRTDFVTNSSDSSFLTFNIQNKKLFDFLKTLGIKIEGATNGELSDRMKITLPSGASTDIDGCNNWSYPYVGDFNSISAWVVGMLLYEIEDCDPQKEADEYSDFAKELIDILNNANITNLDWMMVESWSRDDLARQLSKIDDYDAEMESADIEHAYGFEGEIGPCEKISVTGGKKTRVSFSYSPWDDEEDEYDDREPEDCEDIKFVVTGKLKYFDNREELVEYIEDLGGCVTGSVTSSVDYLICNDADSKTSKTTKARELGVEIISELDFLKRFAEDLYDFDIEEEEDEEEITGDDLWEGLFDGDLFEKAEKKGLTSTVMEIWEDGHWIRQ